MARVLVKEHNNSKNYIINGSMDFWQRATSGTTGFIADRFQVLAATSTTRSTDVPTSSDMKYSMIVAQSAAAYGQFRHRIESSFTKDLTNKTVTLSFWAKSTVGSSSLYIDVNRANSVDNFSATTVILSSIVLAASPLSSWTKYSYSFTVDATAAANGVELVFSRNNTSANTTYYTEFMLNIGAAAPSFIRAGGTYSQELCACQRYYQSYKASGTNSILPGTGVWRNATRADVTFPFPVVFRAIPVVTGTVVGSINVYSGGGASPATAIVDNATTLETAGLNVTTASGPASGTAVYLHGVAAGAGFTFDAEF
jgi:hypothetical protein